MKRFEPGRHGQADYPQRLVVEADVAIVGAGAGGCATAAALAAAGLKVAILEEGKHWKPSEFKPRLSEAMRNLYQQRGARTMRGNTVMALPGGRGVGGSTLINSAICFRCPDSILDDWHDNFGCHTVQKDRFHRYFDKIWETLAVTVQSERVQRLNNVVFKKGAEAMGLNGAFLPRSAPGCVGCGVCQFGCPTGGKASVDRTFLVDALATGNVGVYADCRIRTAESSGGKITAVTGQILDPETQEVRGEVVVHAERFVLSAGPIGSPAFLLANDLASSDHCGRHLVVHPAISGIGVYPFEIVPWHGVTQGYYVDMWDEGFLLQTFSLTPDQYYALLPTPVGVGTAEFASKMRYFGSAGALIHDEDSEGRVQMSPVGPDISYQLGEGDRRKLIEGLRLTGRVFFAAGAHTFLPSTIGVNIIERPEDIDAALPLDLPAHHMQVYASHPMGTCRMGSNASNSVVDAEGKVWGWDNLHVADASVFPTSLGVNPQVTTMAMGLMIGEHMAGVG